MDEPKVPGPFDDATGPIEDPETPDAPRHHGAVKDKANPDYWTVDHRYLPRADEPLVNEARDLVVDDLETRRD